MAGWDADFGARILEKPTARASVRSVRSRVDLRLGCGELGAAPPPLPLLAPATKAARRYNAPPMRFLSALLLVATLAPAQAAAGVDEERLPARYATRGELRWGSDAEGGAPFVFADPADPMREIGFEVDLAAAMAEDLRVAFVRVQTPWESLVQALDRGDCDLAMNGLEPTAERQKLVRFTRPYYIFMQQLVAKAGSSIRSLDDCMGARVGCLGQTVSHDELLRRSGVEPVVYTESARSFLEVDNGRNAAVLCDVPIAAAQLKLFPGLVAVGEPFGKDHYAIAVRRGERDLQLALDASVLRLWQNGSLERIWRKWSMHNDAQREIESLRPVGGDDDGGVVGEEARTGSELGLLLVAAARTVGISCAAFAIAVSLGLALALARLFGPRPVRWLVIAYVEVFRGTPVLVQLLFLYYGLGQWQAMQLPAWIAGVIGLGLNYAAYESEVYRGAISAIPRGQSEASMALGMSGAQTLRFVVLPQALRLSLPASTNDFVALFKDSAVVMVISVVELGKQYQMLASGSGRFVSLGLLTCALYLAMSLPLAFLARRFERSLDGDKT